MKDNLHRLLERQLKRNKIDLEQADDTTKEFIQVIDKTYKHFSKEIEILDTNTSNMIEKVSSYNDNLKNIIDSIDGFNYHVSHDLKSSVINNISLAKMISKYIEKNDLDKTRELIQKLEKNSSLGLELIEKYLEISRFESTIRESKKESCDILQLTKELIQELNLRDQIKIADDQTEQPTILIDSISIKSILQNFVTNAYKYRRRDVFPEIKLLVHSTAHFQQFSFTDNGIGVDVKENEEKIFKPFTRIAEQDIEGNGVGLYLVKKIITRMNGKIWIDSKLGVGTTFNVRIPKI